MKKGTGFFNRSISLIVLFGVLICLPASALSFIPKFETESINFDGTQSSWAEAELKEAYENGLTYGQIENNYQKPITREEFCVIVVKLYEKLEGKAPVLGTNPFTDTDNAEILKAYALGIVKGTSDTTFTPANNITRQEICVMILRALKACKPGIDTSLGSDFPFQDSSSIASWALDAMKFAYKNDIMKGTSATTISPLNNTNREQAIVLLKRTFTKYSEAPKAQTPVDINEYYGKLKVGSSYDPEAEKNKIFPYVPANDSGSISVPETNIGLQLGIKPGLSVIPKPGTESDLKPKPGSGLALGMSDDLHVLTPEEIEEYWDKKYAGEYEEEYEPSGEFVEAGSRYMAGTQYLGRGFDVITGKFADPDSMKNSPVMSRNKLLADKRILYTESPGSLTRFIEGQSIKSYSQHMATNVGVSGRYLYFSGSLNSSFNTSSMTESTSRYATFVSDLSQYGVYFDDRNMNYLDYLDPIFKKHIDDSTIPPEEIFQMYGTHVVRHVRMGGRLDYNVTASSSYVSESSSFRTEVEASFNAGFASVSGHAEHSGSSTSESFNKHCKTNIKAYPGYRGVNDLNPADYNAWFNSVERNPALCDFGGERPLIPIYNMTKDVFRRAELKAGYEKYARENQYVPNEVVSCINGIRLNPQPVSATIDGLDLPTIYDQGDVWNLVSNISPWMNRADIQEQVYVRKGFSDVAARPPVVAIFGVNETQGENAKEIFKHFWGNDSTAKLWGDGGEVKSHPSLKSYISGLPVGDKIKLYYVTSTNERPITKIRVRHLGLDNQMHYFPGIGQGNTIPADDSTYYPVLDYGSLMNGTYKYQDFTEGTPTHYGILPINKNTFIEYSYD